MILKSIELKTLMQKNRLSSCWIERRYHLIQHTSSDGREVRASASDAVNWGFDSESDQTNNLKLVFRASLLDAQH